ncbi:MAG: PAS domain S-box protein [Chloroflexi bacterium]|nr:PAS domain S-box protein [Chloroflexota bacterium]
MAIQLEPSIFVADAQISLRLLVESAPIAIAVVDGHGQIVYINAKLAALFGYQPNELLGKLIEVLMPARFHDAHLHHRFNYMLNPHVRSMGSGMDLAGQRKDGTEFPIEAGLSHLMVGDQLMVIATITDISRRKETEALLERRVEERTREIEQRRQVSDGLRGILAILNSNRSLEDILAYIVVQASLLLAADASLIYSLDERNQHLLVQASNGLASETRQRVGLSIVQSLPSQALGAGKPLVIADAEQDVAISTAGLSSIETGLATFGYRAYLVVPIKIKLEVYGALLLCYHQARHFSREAIELALSVGDQTALAIENARLHTQIEHAAVAAERNRIARDLHDAVTQTLFSASMIAEVLPRIWQRNQVVGQQKLEELRALTRGALAEMRTLLIELRPAKLAEIELADLLRQLADGVTGRARVAVTLFITGQAELPPDVKVAFYRIAQEALNNVAKHARAQNVQINLRCDPDLIDLFVADDGCGFRFETITPVNLGLSIMQERAEAIGATLSVESLLDEGTKIGVQWRTR